MRAWKPYLRVKVQSCRESGALEHGPRERAAFDGAEVSAECCKFLTFSHGKITTEIRSPEDGGGAKGIQTRCMVLEDLARFVAPDYSTIRIAPNQQ